MKKINSYSRERTLYLKKRQKDKVTVIFFRFALLVFIFGFWELFAEIGLIDPFITSSPSRIIVTIRNLILNDNFMYHIGITLYESSWVHRGFSSSSQSKESSS